MAGHLAHLRYRLGTRRQIRQAARDLRRAAERATTPAEIVAVARTTAGSPTSIDPLQVTAELEAFLALLAGERPRRILEIGTGSGGTLYLLAWASDPSARILSLDLNIYPEERRLLYREFAGGHRHVDVWAADSHLDETRDRVRTYFEGEPLDLLFIDGAHAYDIVRRDFELYAPLVRTGGLVAFHDIVDGPHEAVGDVPRFWREIRATLGEPVELVESWEQGGYGIGVGRRAGS